jgi:hypothetical protein
MRRGTDLLRNVWASLGDEALRSSKAAQCIGAVRLVRAKRGSAKQ